MLVGLDLGTSRFRAIGFNESGRRMATVDGPAGIRHGLGGAVTIHPDEAWASVARLLATVSTQAPVSAIGVCAQLGVLGVNRAGRPTTPAILWSDQRASDEARAIGDLLGDAGYALARRPIVAELPAAKVRWLTTHRPSSTIRTRWWISLKDYIVLRLTAEITTDPTHASYTGLYDVAARTWSPRLAEAAGIDLGSLPSVQEAPAVAGAVSRAASRVTGVAAGTVVAVGAPDGTAGAIGAGAVRSGVTVDVAGSTDVLFRAVRSAGSVASTRLIVNAFAVPGLWAIGGPTGLSGGAVLWLAHLLGFESASALRAGLRAQGSLNPSSDGLVFRTELTGSRFPDWRPEARGLISGIRAEHGAAQLLRAAEEGSAFLVGAGLDEIADATGRIAEVIIVGGASRDQEGLELRADAWNRTVRTVFEPEASALGAAMLGAVAAGSMPSLPEAASSMVHPKSVFRPRPRRVSALAIAKAAWRKAGGG